MDELGDAVRKILSSGKVLISKEWTPEMEKQDIKAYNLQVELGRMFLGIGEDLLRQVTVKKYVAEIPIHVELLFDVTPYELMPLWMRKEYLRLGHGMGKQAIVCPWPRSPQFRTRREYRRWLQEPDLSDCPYYNGKGTCDYGCTTKPSCITDEPLAGWPRRRSFIGWLRKKDKGEDYMSTEAEEQRRIDKLAEDLKKIADDARRDSEQGGS